jgi:hypothetical protein
MISLATKRAPIKIGKTNLAGLEKPPAREVLSLYLQSLRRVIELAGVWSRWSSWRHCPLLQVWKQISHEVGLLNRAWQILDWDHRPADAEPDLCQAHITGITWAHKIIVEVVARIKSANAGGGKTIKPADLASLEFCRPEELEELRAALVVADSVDEDRWVVASQSDVARALGFATTKNKGLIARLQEAGILLYTRPERAQGQRRFLVQMLRPEHHRALVAQVKSQTPKCPTSSDFAPG